MVRVGLILVCLAASAGATKPAATEVFRQELFGLSARGVALRADGITVGAWIAKQRVVVDERTVVSRGEQDLVVTWTSRAGRLLRSLVIGSPGAILFEDVLDLGVRTLVAVRATGPVTLAGKTYGVRPRRKDDVVDLPEQALIIRIDKDKVVNVARPFEEPYDVCLESILGPDVMAAGSWMRKDRFFGHAELVHLRPDGSAAWRQRFDGVEINGMDSVGWTPSVATWWPYPSEPIASWGTGWWIPAQASCASGWS